MLSTMLRLLKGFPLNSNRRRISEISRIHSIKKFKIYWLALDPRKPISARYNKAKQLHLCNHVVEEKLLSNRILMIIKKKVICKAV